MFDYLDRLRAQPEWYRLRVAIVTAGVITVIIFLVWATTLSVRLFGTRETASEIKEEPSPLETFQAQLGAAAEGLTSQFDSLRESFGSIEYELSDSPQSLPR